MSRAKYIGLKIYKWIIISIALQIMLLLLINNYFLARHSVTTSSYEVTGHSSTGTAEKPAEKIKIPSSAQNVKLSFDGSLACYTDDSGIQVFNIAKKTFNNAVTLSSGDVLNFYRWLPDRKMIIYAIKSTFKGSGTVQITTRDMETGLERTYPKISGLTMESKVVDIELSPHTNVVYVNVDTGNKSNSVYKYNIMDNLSYVMSEHINEKIWETKLKDKILYQGESGKVYVRDGTNDIYQTLKFKDKIVLLGLDAEDMAYICTLDSTDKVNKIYYGNLSSQTPEKTWASVELIISIKPEDMVVTPNGSIYGNLKDKKIVKDLKNGNEVPYTGDLIEIIDGFAVSLDDGEIKLNKLN